jgi:acetyltransferase EpsM
MQDSARKLLILGTRTLAEEIADLASEVPGIRHVGYVENMEQSKAESTIGGLPVHWVEEVPGMRDDHWAVCGLATTHRERFIDQVSAAGLRFATLVHPSSRISTRSSIGEGTILSVNTVIAAHTTLGRHVLINRGALIGHHTEIKDFVTIQPGANIAGACRVGKAAYIGMGAVVIDGISIGTHSVVGAGAVVTKDVPDHVLVVGVPAKIVKENIAGK